MQRIMLDAEAGQVSAELAHRGIAAATRVHVLVDIMPDEPEPIPLAAMNQGGGAFDWLGDEPDLYSDADLAAPRS
ncbi:hypothetical protein [Lichenibacterium dinghuense]|uniref:hypothetical protein n=1 Tax=Lichenibacterium dinghuense TaxID=2895977 RepID=UPI001F2D6BCA|nr:hypothetical protein [Lichenibacterium sp. 6Y81]